MVAIPLRAIAAALLGSHVLAALLLPSLAEVEANLTTIDQGAVLGFESGGRVGRIRKLDVPIKLRSDM